MPPLRPKQWRPGEEEREIAGVSDKAKNDYNSNQNTYGLGMHQHVLFEGLHFKNTTYSFLQQTNKTVSTLEFFSQ